MISNPYKTMANIALIEKLSTISSESKYDMGFVTLWFIEEIFVGTLLMMIFGHKTTYFEPWNFAHINTQTAEIFPETTFGFK